MKDKIYRWVAARLPWKIVYLCLIRIWSLASAAEYNKLHPDDVTWSMVCKILEKKIKGLH